MPKTTIESGRIGGFLLNIPRISADGLYLERNSGSATGQLTVRMQATCYKGGKANDDPDTADSGGLFIFS